ncbi:carbonic anhydrase family protein [Maribacter polysiphoniae]|uniref:Carbonic anhydrase n=1 Tax=Maribacter polysiphoniae TaxID=429344 RepID=A0A316DTV5_9FLAO|nr:carbonic anhydrase family protein [Maribacter polysiphoniae]MBD1262242.1 carbonic anhydrase family protein [Maribacter polysiphoniae]PWK21494.1 carbonic anhydrase [Maribacter polysiphoniae]
MKYTMYAFIGLLVLGACKESGTKNTHIGAETREVEHGSSSKHWSYAGETGPEHWAEIEAESDCNGKFQSPINIVKYEENNSLKPIALHYAENTKIHDVTNNGHSIQYNFESGDNIMVNGLRYDLKQVHFHEPSEHTIDGVRYPLEMHLVHINDSGQYTVIAVMAKEGVSSIPFDFLESFLPLKAGEKKEVDLPFNMNDNLPSNKDYFFYTGSLTTPPCTEGVNWYILKEPITVSLEQVDLLKKLMPINNYRNEQPHNGRQLYVTGN